MAQQASAISRQSLLILLNAELRKLYHIFNPAFSI